MQKKWQEAMNIEMKALVENDTYELVPKPNNRQIVGRNGFTQLRQTKTRRKRLKPDL